MLFNSSIPLYNSSESIYCESQLKLNSIIKIQINVIKSNMKLKLLEVFYPGAA